MSGPMCVSLPDQEQESHSQFKIECIGSCKMAAIRHRFLQFLSQTLQLKTSEFESDNIAKRADRTGAM
jgi:hypothetical protein